ncbi:hypothetical protein [Paraburkholderia diazotrophica]|uniref:hypothetical protein n=1 Tax=Paraburkholderia diazotrophica TaxID=667676 RepID=UPI00316CE4DF
MKSPRTLEFYPDHSLAQAREHRFACGGKRLVIREDVRELPVGGAMAHVDVAAKFSVGCRLRFDPHRPAVFIDFARQWHECSSQESGPTATLRSASVTAAQFSQV